MMKYKKFKIRYKRKKNAQIIIATDYQLFKIALAKRKQTNN